VVIARVIVQAPIEQATEVALTAVVILVVIALQKDLPAVAIDLAVVAALVILAVRALMAVVSTLVAVTAVAALVAVAVVVVANYSHSSTLTYIKLIKGINMKKFLIAATLAFGMAASMQAANATTTDELLQYCKGEGSTNVTCQIYGQAVYDTYLATRNPKTAPSKICVKQPAPSRIQVVDEYIAWANANPSNGPKPAAETMLKFLEGVFPCGK
jgi:hypothetical protein